MTQICIFWRIKSVFFLYLVVIVVFNQQKLLRWKKRKPCLSTRYSVPLSSFINSALCNFCRNRWWGKYNSAAFFFFWRLFRSAKVRFLHEVMFTCLQIKVRTFCSTRGRYLSVSKSYDLVIGPHPLFIAFSMLPSTRVHFLFWELSWDYESRERFLTWL